MRIDVRSVLRMPHGASSQTLWFYRLLSRVGPIQFNGRRIVAITGSFGKSEREASGDRFEICPLRIG